MYVQISFVSNKDNSIQDILNGVRGAPLSKHIHRTDESVLFIEVSLIQMVSL